MRVGQWFAGGIKMEGDDAGAGQHHSNHVVIVGYGFAGETLARMLKSSGIECCAIEMSPSRVWQAKEKGVSVVAGDAASAAILEHAGLMEARALVVGINDRAAAERVVAQAVILRPDLYVLARTVYSGEIERLYKLGAKQVIPQDFEATIEVAAHILKQFGIPDNIVDAQITSMRSGGYAMLRGKATNRAATEELIRVLQTTATQTFFIERESPACNLTIAQTNLRARAGCMIIAVVRNGHPTTNPSPDFLIQSGDVLVLVGAHTQLNAARAILTPPQGAEDA
jgi:CPA2 family monovalent cation:H+ antiporter-2